MKKYYHSLLLPCLPTLRASKLLNPPLLNIFNANKIFCLAFSIQIFSVPLNNVDTISDFMQTVPGLTFYEFYFY